MSNGKFKRYAIDVIRILKGLALDAKKDADNPKDNLEDYAQGVLMGYYSIINLFKRQSFAFCIDQKELELADIKPDVDLLGLDRNPDIESEEDNWEIDVLDEEKIKGYLSDTIILLKEQAMQAKEEADTPKVEFEDYSKGELMAYYCTISILKKLAQPIKIDQADINLTDLDSEFFKPSKGIN